MWQKMVWPRRALLAKTRRQFLAAGTAGLACASLKLSGFAAAYKAVADDPLAERLARDPLRPQFHLLPSANWMNDPNGPVFWRGKYHLFFQYNPHGAYWGDMRWAHATSTDLVHWKHLPVALAPTPGGGDSDGCFTGSMVIQDGTPTIIYTGVKTASKDDATLIDGEHMFRETQCLATSHDAELRTWNKLLQPVIAKPPVGMKVTGFRDPCPWRDDEWWYLAVGSGRPQVGGEILLYRSHDLRRWEYLHALHGGKWSGKPGKNPVDTGEMWECPDFFALDGRHVLLYSTEGRVIWEVGDYDTKELKFHPQKQGLLDVDAYYAPKSLLAPDGKRVLFGWIPEKRPEAEYKAAGWAGAMALPRVLNVDREGELEMRVVPQVHLLRAAARVTRQMAGAAIESSGSILRLSGLVTGSFPANDGPITLSLGREPHMLMRMRYENKTLRVGEKILPIETTADGRMRFNVFLDGSIIECFVNDRVAITTRVYPSVPADGLETLATLSAQTKGPVDFRVWQMRAISPDRLTT